MSEYVSTASTEGEFNEFLKPVRKDWWKCSKENVHHSVWGLLQRLADEQGHHRIANKHHAQLYGNAELLGFAPDEYKCTYASEEGLSLSYNLVASIIDTVMSRTAKNKPRPFYLTEEGNHDQREAAQGLTKVVTGDFYRNDVHTGVSPDAAADACVFGTGVWQVDECDDRVIIERVFPDEIKVDDWEGRYRKPRSMFRHSQGMGRDEAMARWGSNAAACKAIERAPGARAVGKKESICDTIEVAWAWHLPSSKEADDGRMVVALRGETLIDMKWKLDRFPLVFLRFQNRRLGFFGCGVTELIAGIQEQVNGLLDKISECLRMASPHIFVRRGASVSQQQLNNEIWSVIECDEPPQTLLFSGVPPELFLQLQELKAEAYAEVGLSSLTSRGEKPAGVNSGKGLRTLEDIEAGRFTGFLDAYQTAHLELSELVVETARGIQKRTGSYAVRSPGDRGSSEVVDLAKIDLDRDSYVMQAFPTSFLATTPSARLEDVKELVDAFPELQPFALSLLDFPDLRGVTAMAGSAHDIARMVIESMVRTGKYVPPEPQMDLELTKRLAQQYYMYFKLQGVDPSRLELLIKFVSQCQAMLKKIQQDSQPPAPPTMPVDPTAMPMPPSAAPAPMMTPAAPVAM